MICYLSALAQDLTEEGLEGVVETGQGDAEDEGIGDVEEPDVDGLQVVAPGPILGGAGPVEPVTMVYLSREEGPGEGEHVEEEQGTHGPETEKGEMT